MLYQIDPATYQAAYDSAKAALAGPRPICTAIRSRAERYKELVAIKAVSQQDYDDAAAALKQAEADIEVEQGGRGDGPHQPGIHPRHRAHLRAHRQVDCDRGRPRDGESAGPPSRPFSSSIPIYVDVTQSSADLLRLQAEPGSRAAQTDGGPTQARVKLSWKTARRIRWKGRFKFPTSRWIRPPDRSSCGSSFPTRSILLPGMFVRAVVEEGVNEQAILVPQQARLPRPEGESRWR